MSVHRGSQTRRIGPYNIKIYRVLDKERIIRHLGSGLSADVYLVKCGGVRLAKKVFNPSTMARFLYALLYQSKHPYLKLEAVNAAFWRRRIAHRLGALAGRKAYIVDAFAMCKGGFYSPFIDGRAPTYEEALRMRSLLHPLELQFHLAGMPVWSFGETLNWRWQDNVIIDEKGRLAIPDYEAGLPSPHPSLLVHFDDVDLVKLKSFVVSHKYALIKALGEKHFQELEEAIENYQCYAEIWKKLEMPIPLNIARGLLRLAMSSPLGKMLERRRWRGLHRLCHNKSVFLTDRGIFLKDGHGRILSLTKREKLGIVEYLDETFRRAPVSDDIKSIMYNGFNPRD